MRVSLLNLLPAELKRCRRVLRSLGITSYRETVRRFAADDV